MAHAEWREMLRWQIAKEMGWSLAAIDALSVEDLWAYLSVRDGIARVEASLARKHAQARPRRGRRRRR